MPHFSVSSNAFDFQLLAEATKKIFGSLLTQNEAVSTNGSDVAAASKTVDANTGEFPEWAQVLEPVRKLPTNVGARIRKCVYEALKKDPPEWAKRKLEHSISKEVYKGNASGPTKVLFCLKYIFSLQGSFSHNYSSDFISFCSLSSESSSGSACRCGSGETASKT